MIQIPQSSEPVEKVIGNIGQELNQYLQLNQLLAGTKDFIEQEREGIDDEMAAAAKQLKKKPSKVSTASAAGGGPSASSISPTLDKTYSRFESEVSSLQRDTNTYLDDPEEFAEEFGAFKSNFSLEKTKGDIDKLLTNTFMADLHSRIVPDVVEEEEFWSRYFFKLLKLKQKEDQRTMLTQRAAISMQEEEEPWDDLVEETHDSNPPPSIPPPSMHVVDENPVVEVKPDEKPVVEPIPDQIKASVQGEDKVKSVAQVQEGEPSQQNEGESREGRGPTSPDREGRGPTSPDRVHQPPQSALRKSTVQSDDSFKSWEKVESPDDPSSPALPSGPQPMPQPNDEVPAETSKEEGGTQEATHGIAEKKSERMTQTTPGLTKTQGAEGEKEDWADWD